jgi:transposase
MNKKPWINHAPAFKATVALEVVKGDQTIVEIADRYQVQTNQITTWKKLSLDHATGVFSKSHTTDQGPDLKELHAKICHLSMENGFLSHALGFISGKGRKAIINRETRFPITRQCEELELSLSGVYYTPISVSTKDVELMHQIDEMHLLFPF